MKKLIFLYLLALIISEKIASAQTVNNININFSGNASLISLNYERAYFIREGLFIAPQLGVGYFEALPFCTGCGNGYITFPHQLTANFGKGKHFFETGLGGTIISHNYLLYPIIGFRYHPFKSNTINFRFFTQLLWPKDIDTISIIPISIEISDEALPVRFGISGGATF